MESHKVHFSFHKSIVRYCTVRTVHILVDLIRCPVHKSRTNLVSTGGPLQGLGPSAPRSTIDRLAGSLGGRVNQSGMG